MDTQPLVSIVIPCFNYGKFIKEAIESCLVQTYENIEIIVINDRSNDHYTIDVLNRLNYPKTTVIHHLQNRGVAAARNTGIEHSTGKYILPLDADDKIAPAFIQKTSNILDSNHSVGFVSTGIRHFGNRTGDYIPPPFSIKKLLYHNLYVVTSLFRKEAWQQVGGFNEAMIDGYEDWDFWLSLVEHGWLGDCVNEVLFYYRSHHKSSKNEQAKKKHLLIVEQIINNHPKLYGRSYNN